ncbi:MAG TPA: TIGR03557 family F420-dependent LLM class oxidoreductase [Streptosporangiaceae bacterium]|nr:TIGR03557 family F420-dependent LLM class oxidoreductase [Streptosporangiaceae bacterium]
MTSFGYTLSSEEFGPGELVAQAQRAEQEGFEFAVISDHFHPWVDAQGQAPFVWATVGGVATATSRIRLGTGVTCPMIRLHPAIVAQAAATAAAMMPGRFFLGVGSGENLNEHITGNRWPPASVRLEMLEEAVTVIRLLWQGGTRSHHGRYYTVENARLYTLPDPLPPVYVAAAGGASASLAGRIGDGLISVAPSAATVDRYRDAGGGDRPRYGQIHVCWADSEKAGRETALRVWPIAGIPGALNPELATPALFEQAAQTVRPDDLGHLPAGPDPASYLETIRRYEEAGFTHLYFHQIGPDQEGFFRFWQTELAPALGAHPPGD